MFAEINEKEEPRLSPVEHHTTHVTLSIFADYHEKTERNED